MQIITNNHARPLQSFYDLPEKVQKDFDYLNRRADERFDLRFVQYKGVCPRTGPATSSTATLPGMRTTSSKRSSGGCVTTHRARASTARIWASCGVATTARWAATAVSMSFRF